MASLSAYTLKVNQISMGSATLSWNPPTQNTDGSTLTNLAGYKIYYGRASTSLDNVVTITQAGITRYVVENLSPATWYFSMTSLTSTGVDSSKSSVVSKTISQRLQDKRLAPSRDSFVPDISGPVDQWPSLGSTLGPGPDKREN